MNIIRLLNREMTIVHPPCLVQGILGEKVGVSKFSPKHSCHMLELTPEAYEKNAKALMQASHIALRRWEPHFVFEEVPEKVREFWDGYNAGMDGKSNDANWSREKKAGYLSAVDLNWFAGAPAEAKKMHSSSLLGDVESVGKLAEEFSAGMEGRPICGMQAMDSPTGLPQITAEAMKAADDYVEQGFDHSKLRAELESAGANMNKPVITHETKYWALIKAAKDEGVDISKCGTNAERAKAINEHRCQPR